MAARSDVCVIEKVFGHCEIIWKIENFFLATSGENWIISTPEIYVRKPKTKWKLWLKANSATNDSMMINLERLKSDPGPKSVCANWIVTLIAENDEDKETCYKDVRTKAFVKGHIQGDILERELISKHMLLPYEDKDTFYIRCRLMVYEEDVYKITSQFDKDYNFTELKNFITGHANGKNHDIVVIHGSKKIKAHRGVLSRSSYFKDCIEKDPNCIESNLSRFEFSNIIAFLYSGDLQFVLSKPSILLYDCIKQLRIKELHPYYLPNQIRFNTALNVQHEEFQWVIENVSSRTEDTITSPILNGGISESCWKLELRLIRVEGCMRMSIYAERREDTNPNVVFFEFVARNSNDCCFKVLRGTRLIERDAIIQGGNCFEGKLSKLRSMLPDDKLYIVLKTQILLGETVYTRKSRITY